MKRYWKVIIVIFCLMLTAAGIAGYLLKGNANGSAGSDTTQPNQQTTQNTTQNNASDKEVTLSNGDIIRIGTDVEVLRPTYWATGLTMQGTVTDMQEQTGHALILVTGGVAELNYRYVVDVKVNKLIASGGDDGPSEAQTEIPFTDTVRAVVTLDERGKEILHFIRDLDNPAGTVNHEFVKSVKYAAVEINDMTQYKNVFVYHLIRNGQGEIISTDDITVPTYVIDFYKKNSQN